MSQVKRKHGTQPIHIIKQSIWEKLLIGGFILLFGTTFAISLGDFTFDSPVAILAGIFAIGLYALLILSLFAVLNITTEIYENGFGVRQGSSFVFTTWDNLSHFEVRIVGRSTVVGIVTHEPVEERVNGGWLERVLSQRGHDTYFMDFGASNAPTKSVGLFKPPIVDRGKVLETEFGHYLYEYAPHLFGESKSK